jgi:hemerythrin
MSLLEWRDEFRIGIDEIDHEHRVLIGLINAAHARGAHADRLDAALGEIHALIAAHFALEEKDMGARHYPALPAHKVDHERLLDELREIMDRAAEEGASLDAEFGERLATWFSEHFRTHDAALHYFVAGSRCTTPQALQ